MADITVSEHSGFCFGVKRAVKIINESLDSAARPIYCLGELIHNPVFNESLKRRGVKFISESDIPSLPEDALVFIRTHGAVGSVYTALRERNCEFVDATCPYVAKIHAIVASQPADTKIIVIGDREHPEVRGIVDRARGEVEVFADSAEIASAHPQGFSYSGSCILAVQTTYSGAEWEKCRALITKFYPACRVFDTICGVTGLRQREAGLLAENSDMTVVVGGRHSSNTVKLYGIAREVCKNTLLVETADELDVYADMIRASHKIAIAAGASTPDGIIQDGRHRKRGTQLCRDARPVIQNIKYR